MQLLPLFKGWARVSNQRNWIFSDWIYYYQIYSIYFSVIDYGTSLVEKEVAGLDPANNIHTDTPPRFWSGKFLIWDNIPVQYAKGQRSAQY